MAENKFQTLDNLFTPQQEEDEQATRFDAIDSLYNAAGQTIDLQTSELPEPKPIDKQADELGSRYWEGMDFEDAMSEYKRLEDLPNTETEMFSGFLKYRDTETGRVEMVPMPRPAMFRATFDAAKKLVQAPFSEDVSVQDAADAFTNPKATTSGMELLQMGIRESVDDARELGAAVIGNDEAVERLQREGASVDTEDSFIDGAIADGGPALLAAIAGDKGISKIPKAVSYLGRMGQNLMRVVGAEAAATSTLGTEEGTLIIGEEAAIPIWNGLDLGDSKSDAVIEQRVNAFTEAVGLTGLIAGVGRTSADVGELVIDMTIRPIVNAVGPESMKERVIFNDIASRLSSVTEATTEQERFEIIKGIADTIEVNKQVFIDRLDANKEELPMKLDTLNSLLRGIDDPQMASEIRKVIAGMNTKAMPKFTQALERPKARIDAEIQEYLDSVDASTPGQQTQAMQDVADDFAGQANQYIGEATAEAEDGVAAYNAALGDIGSGIASDLEFADRLKQLETVTGTEIADAKRGKLTDIMEGVRLGYEDLTNQKNMLYADIEGGVVDADGLFDQLFDLNDDQISAALATVRRSNPIKNMLDVVNTKTVPDVDPETGKDIMRPATVDERRELFRELIEGQGADFGYFYNTIRPELSALASDLYKNNPGAGRVVRDLVRYIDEDMVGFVENGSPELADAARAAKEFYKDTYAPIFSGEGVMADYANLYDRTVGRTSSVDITATGTPREYDAAGYNQGVERITKDVMSSGMVAQADQMLQALNVASDPNAMADYMVLDVLDKYATDIRINGLDGAKLTGMSQDLQRYADQLNELFPEKATQITQFVSQIEEAARSKGNLDAILPNVESAVKQARDDISQTELMGFLRTELGNDQFLPTSNPQAAFSQLFNSKEGLAAVENINLAINSLPPERAALVKRGLEVAYTRQFRTKLSDFRMEIGGATPLKEVPLAKAQQEFDQLLRLGREVFAEKPEVAQALEQYSEVAGFVQANKNARTNIGLSPTAFLQEATTATNRLIFTFIGPLSRLGTRVRAFSSAAFQKLDPEQKAMGIYDEILSNPDKFVELARKYNQAPNDREAQDALARMLLSTTIKTTSATDPEDVPDTLDGAIDTYVAPYAQDAAEAMDYLDQQMQGLQ